MFDGSGGRLLKNVPIPVPEVPGNLMEVYWKKGAASVVRSVN